MLQCLLWRLLQDYSVHRADDGRQFVLGKTGGSRYLKRATSGGADDWRVFRSSDGSEYIASECGASLVPAQWCRDLFKPAPPDPPGSATPRSEGPTEDAAGRGQDEDEDSVDKESVGGEPPAAPADDVLVAAGTAEAAESEALASKAGAANANALRKASKPTLEGLFKQPENAKAAEDP